MSVHTYNVRAVPNLTSKPCWDLFLPFAQDILEHLENCKNDPKASAFYQKFVSDMDHLQTLLLTKEDDIRDKFKGFGSIKPLPGYPGIAQMGAVISQFAATRPELNYHTDGLWASFNIEDALVFFFIQRGDLTAGQVLKECRKAAKRVKLPNSRPWKVETDSLTEDYITNVIGSHPSPQFHGNLRRFLALLGRNGQGPWSAAELAAFKEGYDRAIYALSEGDDDVLFEGAINSIVRRVNDAGKKEGRNKPRNVNAIRHRFYETDCQKSEVGRKLLAVANKLSHPESDEMALTVLATPPQTQKAVLQDVRATFDKVAADQGLTLEQKDPLAVPLAPSMVMASEKSASNMTLTEALEVWMSPTMNTTPAPSTKAPKGNTTLDAAILNGSKAVREVVNAPIASSSSDYFIPEERPLAPSILEELKAKAAADPDYFVITQPASVFGELKDKVLRDTDYFRPKEGVPLKVRLIEPLSNPCGEEVLTNSPEPVKTQEQEWPQEKKAFFDSKRELTFYYRKQLTDNGLSEFGEHEIRTSYAPILFNKGNFWYAEVPSVDLEGGTTPKKKPIYVDHLEPSQIEEFVKGIPSFDNAFNLFIQKNSRHKAWAGAATAINDFLNRKNKKEN